MRGFGNLALWIPLLVAFAAPVLGLVIGLWIDREHRADLDFRRRQVGHVLITNLKSFPGRVEGSAVHLLAEPVVLGNNAFLTLIARWKMLFGGEVRSFYGLVTRARQEATLRVMERAAELGLDAVCNVRLEPVDLAGAVVGRGNRKNRPIYVGVIAYGMAYKRAPGFYPPPSPPTLMDYLQ